MNKIVTLFLLSLISVVSAYRVDTLLVQTFDNNQGYSANSFSDGASDYFDRWHDSLSLNHDFTGAHGANYFVAEDTDSPKNPLGTGEQGYLVIDNIDVTGYDRLQVLVSLAATDGETPSAPQYERNQFGPEDSLIIEYAFDGNIATTLTDGSYTALTSFTGFQDIANSIFSYPLTEDKNNDGTFDGVSLSSEFQDVKYPLSNKGDLFSLRIRVDVDGLDDVGIDNIRIVGIQNEKPVINVPATIYISKTQSFSYGFDISDPDGDALTITYDQVPAQGFTIRNDSVFIDPTQMPDPLDTILISVDDGDVTTSKYIQFVQSGRITDSLALVAINDLSNDKFGWDYTTKMDTWSNVVVSGSGNDGRVTSLITPDSESRFDLSADIQYLTALEVLTLVRVNSIPEEIAALTNMKYLSIQRVNLSESTFDYSVFQNLVTIHFFDDSLTQFPIGIGSLTKLTGLEMTFNAELTEVPDIFGSLSNLNFIDLENNALTTLPASVGTVPNLNAVYLDNNKIESLGFSLTGLDLTTLELAGNKLTAFPDSIETQKNLENLYLHDNEITVVPDSVIALTKLKYLDLRWNQITYLPEAWTQSNAPNNLRVQDNLLEQLPAGLIGTGRNWSENLLQYDVLEAIYAAYPPVNEYLKSSKLFLEQDSLTATVGKSVVLDRQLRGTRNEYQWYKDGAVFGAPESTGTLTILPDSTSGGVYWAEVTQSWFTGVTLTTDTLFVDLNRAPVIISPTKIGAPRSGSITYTAAATDADGDSLSYFYQDIPQNVTVDGLSFTAKFDGALAQPLSIGLYVTDGIDTVTSMIFMEQSDRAADSLALVAIWDSLGNPASTSRSWLNWGSTEALDTWSGVRLNGEGRVTYLQLAHVSTDTGTLAPEVVSLTELDTLEGYIPVKGTLPENFESLTKLKRLVLSPVVESYFPSDSISFPTLEYFALNYYKGTDVEVRFEQSPNLQRVIFSSCSSMVELPSNLQYVTSLTELRSSSVPLTEVPAWIGSLINLTSLELEYANISTVPAAIEKLTKLEELSFYDNKISSFNIDVSKLSTLYEMYLDLNELTAVPEVFRDHPTLEYLYFEENQISEVPMWVFRIPNIDEVEFSDNQITALPDSIIYLERFPSFYFADNQITELPEGFGANGKLPNIMYFENNLITHLPTGFDSITDIPHRFEFEENRLHFDDQERMKEIYYKYEAYPQNWRYDFMRQKNVTDKETLWVSLGDTVKLRADIRGTRDSISYQWHKNGSVYKPNYFYEDSIYTIEGVTESDTGYYSFIAKSGAADNNTISSDTFYVKLNSAPVITSDTVVVATEDIQFSYKGIATNDNGAAQFSYINLPYWLKVESDSVVGTPVDGDSDTSFTLIASDGVLSDSLVVTVIVTDVPDTTVEFDTTNLIGVDTLVAIDSTVMDTKDTLVTTIRTEQTCDTTVITTDTLIDAVVYKTKMDSSVNVTQVVIDTTYDTLEYQPTISVSVDTTHAIVRDTVTAIDTAIQLNGDSLVTTIRTENWIDSMFVRTDSLSDDVSFWHVIDTSVTSGTSVIDTVKQILSKNPVITVELDTTHSVVYDTVVTKDSVIEASDTIVTSTYTENWIGSMFVRTDSLSDGVSYWFVVDTTVTTGSEIVDTKVDTLEAAVAVVESARKAGTVHFAANPVKEWESSATIYLPEGAGRYDVKIFDPVGNLLFEQSGDLDEEEIEWDLRSRNGITVGSGTVLVIIQVTDNSSRVKLYRSLLGIQR